MSIGAGLVLIAVGAILRFGISTVSTHGFSIHTIGDILILVGILGWCCGWWCGPRGVTAAAVSTAVRCAPVAPLRPARTPATARTWMNTRMITAAEPSVPLAQVQGYAAAPAPG